MIYSPTYVNQAGVHEIIIIHVISEPLLPNDRLNNQSQSVQVWETRTLGTRAL